MQKLSTAVKDRVEAYVASGLQEEGKKVELLDNLSKAIEQIQNKFDNLVCNKVVEEGKEVQDLCMCLENIFQHGLREKLFHTSLVLSEKLSFWAVLQKLSMKEDIQTIYRLSIIQTDTSRCRAWIKMKLKDHTIGSYIGLLTDSPKLLREYYGTTAFLRDMVKVESVKTLLQYVIANLDFQIDVDGGEAQQQQHSEIDSESSGPDTSRTDVSFAEPMRRRKSSRARSRTSTMNIAEIKDSDSVSLDSSIMSQSPIPKEFNRSFSSDATPTRNIAIREFITPNAVSAICTKPPLRSYENEADQMFKNVWTSQCTNQVDLNESETGFSKNSKPAENNWNRDMTSSEHHTTQPNETTTIENHVDSTNENAVTDPSIQPWASQIESGNESYSQSFSGTMLTAKQKIEISEILKDLQFFANRPLTVEKILSILPQQDGLTEDELKSYLEEVTNCYFSMGIITNKNKGDNLKTTTTEQTTVIENKRTTNSFRDQINIEDDHKEMLTNKEDFERETDCFDKSLAFNETMNQEDVPMLNSIHENEASMPHAQDVDDRSLTKENFKHTTRAPVTTHNENNESHDKDDVNEKELDSRIMSPDKDTPDNDDYAESVSDDLNFVPGIHEECYLATNSKAKPILPSQRANTIGPSRLRSPRSSPVSGKTRSLGNEAAGKMKSGTSGSSDAQDRLYGFKMNSPTLDSPHSSVNVNQALMFDADYFSDSGTDTCDSINTDQKENIRSILADLGVNDDIIGLKEDHFATPDSFMGFTSGEELEMAIETCKEKIKSMQTPSNERKNLIKHLVQLRLKLHEQKENTSDVSANTKKVLGHQFSKYGKAPGNYFCDSCGATIWAYVNTLYKCIDCSFYSHKKCLNSIDKPCVSKKVSGSMYITDIAPECGLSTQQYRCADCRKRLIYKDGGFLARGCDYTGQFYCSNCHWNEDHVIPARVIHNWDFNPRKVSRQSKHLLNLLSTKPIICLKQLNPALFNFIEDLRDVRALRDQILMMKSYLMSCRLAVEEKLLLLLKKRQHFVENSDTYTLQDLISIDSGVLLEDLSRITALYGKHIKFDCVLCQGKGFICEICRSNDVIYPFDFNTSRCDNCTATYHRSCYRRGICPKCLRIAQRKEKR